VGRASKARALPHYLSNYCEEIGNVIRVPLGKSSQVVKHRVYTCNLLVTSVMAILRQQLLARGATSRLHVICHTEL
jgi:hypothetical protein